MFEEYESIMRVDDVCEAISAGRNYIYRGLNQGILRRFRIGREWRIAREELIHYVNLKSGRK